jgi:hypothetical protein
LGVLFDLYLQWPELSQSVLKVGRKSMRHLKACWDEEVRTEPTDDMILGSALHTAFLEPELMPDRVVKWTGGTRRGEAWNAFRLEHYDKYILTPVMHEKLVGMCKSLRQHLEVRMVNGVRMKSRIDALTADPLIDLKKVADGDKGLFRKNMFHFGYHIQGYIYTQLFERERFLLMTVEDFPPYDVLPWELSPEVLKMGRDESVRLLDQVAECIATNKWPGRSEGIEMLDAPYGYTINSTNNHPTF